jgi:hypothetical protein
MPKNQSFDFAELWKDSGEEIPNATLDLEQIKTNIADYDTKKLCEMIVVDRYFGLEQKVSAICMEELASRRLAGEDFDFETYIDQSYKKLPVLATGTMDVGAILKSAIKAVKK